MAGNLLGGGIHAAVFGQSIAGQGNLYQGTLQVDDHFHTVCRDVERNAYSASTPLWESPKWWRWGSLYRWKHEQALLSS